MLSGMDGSGGGGGVGGGAERLASRIATAAALLWAMRARWVGVRGVSTSDLFCLDGVVER